MSLYPAQANIETLALLSAGKIIYQAHPFPISHLITDSRKPLLSPESIFFAIQGERHDGHAYLQTLYDMGIRQFVIEDDTFDAKAFPKDTNLLLVESSLKALQNLAAWHRQKHGLTTIGITGSNGKTIVKEWLAQMMSASFNVVKSPKSYNSQLGVALSLWQINSGHEVGIFEAGISTKGEMSALQRMIRPEIGILTNIGPAHAEGFKNDREKLEEKLKLFKNADFLVCRLDEDWIADRMLKNKAQKGPKLLAWSLHKNTAIQVSLQYSERNCRASIRYFERFHQFDLPFTDMASLENALHCVMVLLHLEWPDQMIQKEINQLGGLSMRLALKQGINSCFVVDDSYNNDLAGLEVALDVGLQYDFGKKRSLILSDMHQTGLKEKDLVTKLNQLLLSKKVEKLVGIGPVLHYHQELFQVKEQSFFVDVESFRASADYPDFHNELVLVKGARSFGLERIVQDLEEKIHGTVLEINLDALTHNLNYYRSKIGPDTKLMVMVKAFAYGAGSHEVARLMQFHRVDYLAVAYADEGVSLRQAGITLPIMVMNPSPESFDKILQHQLEPEIYNFRILQSLLDFLSMRKRHAKIHLKLDTGMHRLGFEPNDIPQLIAKLKSAENSLELMSVFSHLAASDEATHNAFSHQQAKSFSQMAEQLEQDLGKKFIRHLLNSPGILRFPAYHFDMVRLGIGLYGVEVNGLEKFALQAISSLKTIISQIKQVKAGESIGYARKGQAEKDMRIATIAIGYADGFSRAFSQGKGSVVIRGQRAKVIGNVCMDMCMVDISHIPEAREGDEVEIFGKQQSISELAKAINTIPYEILTNVSERVKRVYFSE